MNLITTSPIFLVHLDQLTLLNASLHSVIVPIFISMEEIVFIVEKTSTGFSAYADAFEKYSVTTTGDNIEDLKENIYEALNFYLEEEAIQIPGGQIVLKYDFEQIP